MVLNNNQKENQSSEYEELQLPREDLSDEQDSDDEEEVNNCFVLFCWNSFADMAQDDNKY
jgi:hypothetical protein